jgi:TonB family protein
MKLILSVILLILTSQTFLYCQAVDLKDVKKHSCSCKSGNYFVELVENLTEQSKFIKQCLVEAEENRRQLNLVKPLRISHFNPIAISLVKPYYPELAKQLQISGEVLVEVIADEQGNVIHVKILSGSKFFAGSVKEAVCNSKFIPQIYCQKSVKMHYFIKYNFTLN